MKTMMKNKDFVVMILTHGRPNTVVTDSSLRKQGYTGRILYVVDNEDKTVDEYRKNFGEDVVQFDKKAIADKTDEGDNFDDRRTITHARNASFEIAKKMGYKYWIQFDDDYIRFHYRLYKFGKAEPILNMDAVFDTLIDFYEQTPAVSVAMAQGGDFIGGDQSQNATNPRLLRKCMNSFICSTERPYKFVGRMNEDVNTYTSLASRGTLFLTVPLVSLTQKATQTNEGGITETYLKYGTYVKSFYTVMFAPSCTKIAMMHTENSRIHHQINWKTAVPVIVNENLKKKR